MNITNKPFLPSDRPRAAITTATRNAMAAILSRTSKRTEAEVVQETWPHLTRAGTQHMTRASTLPVTTSDAGALATVGVGEFISALAPQSAAAGLRNLGLQMSFDRNFYVTAPSVTASAAGAKWVAQGAPTPAMQLSISNLVLEPRKLSVIVPYTRELFAQSGQTIESVVRTTMPENVVLQLDSTMFDTNDETSARPRGLRFGINTTAPASAGATVEETVLQDVENLATVVGAVSAGSPIALIANLAQCIALRKALWNNPDFVILPSPGLAAHILIAVATNCFVSVTDNSALAFDVSDDATLFLDDTPTDIVAGGVVAAGTVRSTWQTDTLALTVRMSINFGLRSATGLAWTTVVW